MKWTANYKDGTQLMQFEGDKENSYFDIKRDQLTNFSMFKEDRLVLSVEFERPSQKLIYRKRTFIDINGNVKGVVYLVGWHENIKCQNIKVINYIYPNGKIVLAGAKDDLELISMEVE
jgi:hypothetical protein